MAENPKIIIADDDPTIVKILTTGLQAEGFTVIACLDAYQALEKIGRDRPAVVILDIHMPAGGGLSVVERLKKMAHIQQVPVIFLTSDLSQGVQVIAKQLGACALLYKPVDIPKIASTIRAVLAATPVASSTPTA